MTLPVFYRPEQVALNSASYSPSAAKPQQVVADWQRHGLDITLHGFEPVTRAELYLAHDDDYVDGVLDLTVDNGFGNRDPEVAASLPYTTGSMLAAAEHAIIHRTTTCSPTSGFHHAGYGFGGGYCTFNGLMVAALKLKQDGLVNKVAVIDCDAHYGNGTDDIIDYLGLDWVKHHTSGKRFVDRSDIGTRGKQYFDWLKAALQDAEDCDLIIYQAGADPHISDPLGGILENDQLFHRDRLVFEHAIWKRIPLVWNLAGGYRRDKNGGIAPVLMTHRITAQTCLGQY